MTTQHIPVLLAEALDCLQPQPGKIYVDATLGGGGHAQAVLERIQPDGLLLGIDQDLSVLENTRSQLVPFQAQVRLFHGNFAQLPDYLAQADIPQITGGILADLGVSSFQLDQAERGFSFSKTAPLDMRMNPDSATGLTAAEVVNTYSEEQLTTLFKEYGEERFAKPIARSILHARQERPINTTTELAELIRRVYHRFQKGKQREERIHPATRVFQALRIEVNNELGQLEAFLSQLPSLMAPGARITMISFHSLEDRIVKRFFQRASKACLCPPGLPICQCDHQATLKIITTKPITPTEAEIQNNPRSRSAKLRCAERL